MKRQREDRDPTYDPERRTSRPRPQHFFSTLAAQIEHCVRVCVRVFGYIMCVRACVRAHAHSSSCAPHVRIRIHTHAHTSCIQVHTHWHTHKLDTSHQLSSRPGPAWALRRSCTCHCTCKQNNKKKSHEKKKPWWRRQETIFFPVLSSFEMKLAEMKLALLVKCRHISVCLHARHALVDHEGLILVDHEGLIHPPYTRSAPTQIRMHVYTHTHTHTHTYTRAQR